MTPTELGRRLFADMMHLPLMFKLFLLYGAGTAIWGWWKARRQAEVISTSESWPVYKARVVWAQVTEWNHHGKNDSSYVEGVLTYSYTVPGHELEVGDYRKRFDDEEEAAAWAQSLRDTSVDVRVDPADVTRSVYQESPILTAPLSPKPVLESSRLQDSETWEVRQVFATAVFLVAVVGAFFAAWIQLSCLKGKPLISAENNGAAFFGMHIGAMACAFGVAYIARPSKWSRSSWKKALEAGTSGIAIKILGLYSTVVFLYGWIRMAANDGDPRYFGVLMFSAVWLIIYVSAAAGSLRAIQHRVSDAERGT